MSRAGVGLYVYGVMSRLQEPMMVRGVADAEVRAVGEDGLVALVSCLTEPMLSPSDLRAHWRVLERAFAQGTVLPIRFGTVLESDADVRHRLIDVNGAHLSQLLFEMADLVQLNVRGRYDEEALLREIVSASPAVAELRERLHGAPAAGAQMSEQIRLGQLVEAEIARRRAEDTDLALAELEPLAVAARSEDVPHPDAFKLAFLVGRDGEDRLGEGVARVRARLGDRVAIRYVGPLPPFSFAEAELTAGGAVWA